MKKSRSQELLQLVKNNYQEIAVSFDQTRQQIVWPKIEGFIKNVKDGDMVLDVACGNGRLIKSLSLKKINYLGVDNSPALIKLAKKNFPNNRFLVADMLDLNRFSDKDFDYIFCLAALQHIPGKKLRRQALAEMKKKLSTEGVLVISNWNLWRHKKHRKKLIKRFFGRFFNSYQEEWNDLIFPWQNLDVKKKSNRYYHAFTKRELIRLAKEAGFIIKRSVIDEHNIWLELKKQ